VLGSTDHIVILCGWLVGWLAGWLVGWLAVVGYPEADEHSLVHQAATLAKRFLSYKLLQHTTTHNLDNNTVTLSS
jgi:hypothetical protein